jgi:D-alanyl-lipoteichoic acid acyltransferase DltB (MBOAT superfamily)
MLFNTFEFWLFLAPVLLLYRLLPHRGQNRMLLVASYVFYGAWDWRFLGLIAVSTVVDYAAGLRMAAAGGDAKVRRRWLTASLVTNLGLLGVFKYLGFFLESTAELLQLLGFEPNIPSLRIILPVGISFYTFQTLSYSIDVYRRQLEPTSDFLDFALYVSFFPQLVAGPIERAKRLLPQVQHPRRTSGRDIRVGSYLVLLGLFKKVVIADNMAILVNYIFSQVPESLSAWDCLVGVYAFAFQIYGDFHGYSLIAQGVSAWMGFHIMDNFRHPYFSQSPQEFWKRWHISLSSWLRDYLYIPLGGNRRGRVRTYVNLLTTMLLGGLWHGAAWTFVVWGGIHGGWLAIHRWISGRSGSTPGETGWVGRMLKMFVTFQLVCVTWLFFRADTVGQAWSFMLSLGGSWHLTPLSEYGLAFIGLLCLPTVAYEAWVERKGDLMALVDAPVLGRALFYVVLILGLVWLSAPAPSEFIYFQF